MKYLLMFLLLTPVLSAENNWIKDPEKALQMAQKSSKPVLIDFYAEWCGPCKMMDKTTLKNERVLQELASFVLLKVDGDKFKDMVKDYKVSAYPTFIILNTHGEKLATTSGYKDAAAFTEWVQQFSTAATSGVSLAQLDENDFKLLEMLRSRKNTKVAFELLADQIYKNEAKKNKLFIELHNMAKANPDVFLEVLNHESLSCRLVAAQIYLGLYKNEFQYDPWDSQKNRTLQVEKFKGQLK